MITDESPYVHDPDSDDNTERKKDKCRGCGICPIQPLGICLFIRIAAIVLCVIIVIVLAARNKNKKENK